MTDKGVRAVTSNQDGIYKNLEQVVRKYATTRYLRPIAQHTKDAFEQITTQVENFYKGKNFQTYNVVLDSGCGTGESTLHLAKKFPDVPVIGIDKSELRLNKAGNIHQRENVPSGNDETLENAFWVRAELLDFWRLALELVRSGRWQVLHHAVYYPNPWPKESEATRRFHLHPIFPTLMSLSRCTELRTNWEIYAREFAKAGEILGEAIQKKTPLIFCESFQPDIAETAFERKYKEARQQLWRVLIRNV